MVEKGWFSKVILPEEYAAHEPLGGNVIVVGPFSERHEDAIFTKPDRALFINNQDKAKPGQIKDGYYPDAVFSHPDFVIPVIEAALQERVEGQETKVYELLRRLETAGEHTHQAAHGAYILNKMLHDPACSVIMTISGAMTIAQLSLCISDMVRIPNGVKAIASTGALMAHGLAQGLDLRHYKYDPRLTDEVLLAHGLNRVTDTLEPETNFDQIDDAMRHALKTFNGERPIASWEVNRAIGQFLHDHHPGSERAILRAAYDRGVAVYVPAFVDSELGNDVNVHNREIEKSAGRPIIVNTELDTLHLMDLVVNSEKIGIFTLGGGVPRNWPQNIAPYITLRNKRLGEDIPERKFSYGTRICPDAPKYGHLSGCTYREGGSWGKMDLEKGQFAEVLFDATLIFPFYVKYVMDFNERKAV